MVRFNKGLVFTNDKCISCNKCIVTCPITGANVSFIKNGKHRINVSSEKCIHCGNCLVTCNRQAREFFDDTETFFADLAAGKRISIIIDPSFYLIYAQKAYEILGYLRSLGVYKIYDLAYGAEIALWANVNFIRNNANSRGVKKYIANTCSVLINYVEKYDPELIEHIIPIQSPAICTAIYAHKYLGDTSTIALISPCIAKDDELKSVNTDNNINYNVTFQNLMKHFDNIPLDNYHAESDLTTSGLGNVFSIKGTFKEMISLFFPPSEMIVGYEGLNEAIRNIRHFHSRKDDPNFIQPLFVDFLNCKDGCVAGGGIEKKGSNSYNIILEYLKKRQQAFAELEEYKNVEDRFEYLNNLFSDLNYKDFNREFEDRYQQQYRIPQDVTDKIFVLMHKDTQEKRSLNCNACGYKTCYELIKAIACGYAKMESCIHYVNDELEIRYNTDIQTGLPNITTFKKNVASLQEKNPQTQFVICIGDVNKFNIINDLYSYEVGNEVLSHLALAIQMIVGKQGTCARFSGGSFALCIPSTEGTLNELFKNTNFDCSHLGVDFPVTMRFGMCNLGYNNESIDRIINFASFAMNKTNDKSFNTYCFYNNEMREKLLLEASITSQMRKALENEEFNLYFQPQYNHSSGAMVGAEVLCRWIQADGTIISPGVFVPIFEKNGFIKELDQYIWRKSFETIKHWIEVGEEPVPISVNISRISLETDEIIDVIASLKEKYDIPTHLLHFEITESAYINDQVQLIRRINEIRNLGFIIAMDDFGSGYSSLNTLKNMPIDILKLDMGFLRGNTNMDKGGNIISSLVRMAQDLELSTVAEGVETVSQADYLKSIGCDVVQGFLYAKPMPQIQFENLVEASIKEVVPKKEHFVGNLNINNLYNPESSETIMFTNYSGAAAIIECIHDSVSFIRVNDKFLSLFGFDETPYREFKKSFFDHFDAGDMLQFRAAIEYAMSTSNETQCVFKYHHRKINEIIWAKFHIWKISSTGQRFTLYILADNITLEKSSETELIKFKSEMNMIIDNSPIGMCLLKINKRPNKVLSAIKMSVVKTNQAFADLSGFSKEEVLSWTEKETSAVIHPVDLPGFLLRMRHILSDNFHESVSYVYRAKRKDGRYVWIKVLATGIKNDDGSFSVVTNYTRCNPNEKK
ncbi:MAG: EAL domain-containing protein [Spirochaetales bacterium]|nr:EAL domain-containing protein [Spirochaetales bacterium]